MKEPAHVRWYLTLVDFSYWGYPTLFKESINELVIVFRGKDYRAIFVWKSFFFFFSHHVMELDSPVLSHCVTAGQVIHELVLDSTRVLCSSEMEWVRLLSRGP